MCVWDCDAGVGGNACVWSLLLTRGHANYAKKKKKNDRGNQILFEKKPKKEKQPRQQSEWDKSECLWLRSIGMLLTSSDLITILWHCLNCGCHPFRWFDNLIGVGTLESPCRRAWLRALPRSRVSLIVNSYLDFHIFMKQSMFITFETRSVHKPREIILCKPPYFNSIL